MRRHHQSRPRASLRDFADHADWSAFRSVVSLHAHTSYSCEVMADLPGYIARVPIVARLFERQLHQTAASAGRPVDFGKGWWHPPVDPRGVFESESAQIERRFGLRALVSITDHDSIAANLELQLRYAASCAPIASEWTVPFGDDVFHVGVHNLPVADARPWHERLAACTADRDGAAATRLLRELADLDGVLLVLNHPLWDLAGIGPSAHLAHLRAFVDAHRGSLHALELNGYRSRRENGGVRTLSAETGLPVISGGDRHACAPNAIVNVSDAPSFAEFVDEIRHGVSHVVVMPEYREPLAMRKLAAASEVLRYYRRHPDGSRRWFDRVTCEWRGKVRPLSYYWPTGGPVWVRAAVTTFLMLTNPVVLPLLHAALERSPDARDGRAIPRAAPIETSVGVFRLGLNDGR